MIKVKLTNWNKGRNEPTFRPLLIHAQQFINIGIQFVADGSYDFEFIGMEDFLNKKVPLQQSIDQGLEYLASKTGDYYLFDGSDSTSLMGAYEVFEQSDAQYLFKSSKLTQEQYKRPAAFGKWFFGANSDLDLSYNIPDDKYNRIKLTGWNLGYYNPSYLQFDTVDMNRDIDVCAIYQGEHKLNSDHGVRNDTFYSEHRTAPWRQIQNNANISSVTDKRPYPEFIDALRRSKCTISPYGMGEICFRDFETIQFGSVMIKPDMSNVITYPDIYKPYETYIPCALDWSDLIEKIEWVRSNPSRCKEITENAKQCMQKAYTIENLLLYWYDMLKSFNGVAV